ncbi:MAG: 1-phosphofructokinase [Oscillospiraceae bacterium]|nr:1-phosphofructokinase [Oscillospiraceae bacterium]
MVYTLTLNPSLDYVMTVKNLSHDNVNRSSTEELYYGGKGINVSSVLKRLGVESTALGFAGGMTGEFLCEIMRRDGIRNDFISLSGGNTRINVKLKSDNETEINAIGPEISDGELNQLFEKLEQIKNGDTLVLAGSVPQSLPDDIYAQILSRVSGKDICFAVDATGNQLISSLKYKPFLIKPNKLELGEIFGKELTNTDEIIKHGKELQSMGAQNVMISCGGDGAVLIAQNDEIYTAKALKGNVISTVGCGDSMVAGFIAGKIRGYSLLKSFQLSVACASATAFSKHLATADKINEIASLIYEV